MSVIFDAPAIVALHKHAIEQWKTRGISYQYTDFYRLVEENHAFNFQLWHAEDKARREDQGFEFVYQAKRSIDGFNQQRNNCMEAMDTWLFKHLQPQAPHVCPVHSESPGMIIDRLSILALKFFHMELQTKRREVDEAHRRTCVTKLDVIAQQRDQLQQCLAQLVEEVVTKKRTFRVYHQFKMYNDPKLNPELY